LLEGLFEHPASSFDLAYGCLDVESFAYQIVFQQLARRQDDGRHDAAMEARLRSINLSEADVQR